MLNEQELLDLCRRIGLDLAEAATRCRFLHWSDADAARLAAAADATEPAQRQFIETLYEELARFEPLAALLQDPRRVMQLKHSQLDYYERLWRGPYDRDYVLDRLNIGVVHQRVGLDLKWYLGATGCTSTACSTRCSMDSARRTRPGCCTAACSRRCSSTSGWPSTPTAPSSARRWRTARGVSPAPCAAPTTASGTGTSATTGCTSPRAGRACSGCRATPSARAAPAGSSGCTRTTCRACARRSRRTWPGTAPWLSHEYRIRRHDGSYLWVLVRGVAENDRRGHRRMAGSQTDISQRRAAAEELSHAARHDR